MPAISPAPPAPAVVDPGVRAFGLAFASGEPAIVIEAASGEVVAANGGACALLGWRQATGHRADEIAPGLARLGDGAHSLRVGPRAAACTITIARGDGVLACRLGGEAIDAGAVARARDRRAALEASVSALAARVGDEEARAEAQDAHDRRVAQLGAAVAALRAEHAAVVAVRDDAAITAEIALADVAPAAPPRVESLEAGEVVAIAAALSGRRVRIAPAIAAARVPAAPVCAALVELIDAITGAIELSSGARRREAIALQVHGDELVRDAALAIAIAGELVRDVGAVVVPLRKERGTCFEIQIPA